MGDSTKRPLPTGFIVPKQHTERLLIERLQNSKTDEDYFRWLMFVVAFYRGIEKTESARALLQLFLETNENSDQKAHCHLALGQIATDEQRFESAMYHFAAALALNPSQPKVTYVLHNNIGYCHNQLGRYKDAERHCRIAVEINSSRASAYRNLGISLNGQGDHLSAAWAWSESIKLDSSDERAVALLASLVREHPTVAVQCPWVSGALCPGDEPTSDAYRN